MHKLKFKDQVPRKVPDGTSQAKPPGRWQSPEKKPKLNHKLLGYCEYFGKEKQITHSLIRKEIKDQILASSDILLI